MASVSLEVHLVATTRGALKWGSNRRPGVSEADSGAGKGNTEWTVGPDFRLGGCRRSDLGATTPAGSQLPTRGAPERSPDAGFPWPPGIRLARIVSGAPKIPGVGRNSAGAGRRTPGVA